MGSISAQRGGTGGASKALSNLANVAINVSMIPDGDGTLDFGASGMAWANVYVTGTGTFGNITILSSTPILVLKDSNSLGAASIGYIEWRDSGGGRAGFFGNSSSGNDDLTWKNEQGGNIGIETTGAGELQILAKLSMGDDQLILLDVNAGLTASTTQTQGQGALTAQVNEISTVANDNDTVTLPPAVAGTEIEIINDGANTLQMFPASGDNLGLGVDVAEQLEANERVVFVAYDATNWAKESTTEIVHAEIHDEDNTDAYVINDAGADFHAYHTNGLVAGDLANWTFDAGGAGTSFPVASVANSPGSPGAQAQITTTGSHGLAAGDIVSLTNMSAGTNAGLHVVLAPIAATTFEITSTNSANATGTMDQAATLDVVTGSAGSYSVFWSASATSATNNETFDFEIRKNATTVVGTKTRRKFGTATDFGSFSGLGIVDITNGDKISFALSNEDSSANITIRNLTIVLIRL